MQLELDNKSEIEEKVPAVFEAAGGYSPTVGIIGAVLGLIQVMKNLDNIDEVGRGIATAFVATIYGVAVANLICLPAAGKLKFRHREETMIKEMMLEGVICILEGMNPRMMETKLRTYLFDSKPGAAAAAPLRSERMSEEEASRACEPRALAGELRGLHYAAVRVLRGAVRFGPVGQAQEGEDGAGDASRVRADGRCSSSTRSGRRSTTPPARSGMPTPIAMPLPGAGDRPRTNAETQRRERAGGEAAASGLCRRQLRQSASFRARPVRGWA